MKRYRCLPTGIVFLVFLFLTSEMLCADKKGVLENTNKKYYNLKARGLSEFNCQVLPDFDTAYKAINMDSIGRDHVLPIARKLRFDVVVGPSGAASVSHKFSEAPQTEDIAARLRQITDGVDHMVSGFFQTWSQLMINPPLPGSDSEYQMDSLPDGYRFSADAAKIHVAISMNHDLVIESVEATTPEVQGTVRPTFIDTKDGLLLESYRAVYKTPAGSSQELSVTVNYQHVDGVELPKTFTLSMSVPQGQLVEPITLQNCAVKKE
jgi:hypothetical protein